MILNTEVAERNTVIAAIIGFLTMTASAVFRWYPRHQKQIRVEEASLAEIYSAGVQKILAMQQGEITELRTEIVARQTEINALRSEVLALRMEVSTVREENELLRNEVARLKQNG